MAKYREDFAKMGRHIREMLDHAVTQQFTDPQMQGRADALRTFFLGQDAAAIATILDEWNAQAPMAFDLVWPSLAKPLIETFTSDPARAIFNFARLLGWAYIEAYWGPNSMVPNSAAPLATLAGIHLGLSHTLTDTEVLSALSTHKAILTDLLIRRFEKSVSGGLDQINNAGKNVEGRTSGWEERLGKLEIRTNSAEEKIGAYASSLQQYQVAFGFLGLSAAFRQFFRRKWWERTILLIGLILFFIAIVCVPFIAHQTAEKAAKTRAPQPALAITDDANAGKSNAPKDAAAKAAEAKKGTMPIRGGRTQQAESEGSNDSVWLQLRPYLPFTVLELLLIYFFRVILMHFNSTQVQMLQLEIRMAACAFIDEYVKFVREHGKPDLSKFESLVFGGIAADSDKLPSTFDGIEQLASLVKEIRTAKR